MAISTYKTYLMSGSAASSLTKLIDIKSFGDLGGQPEALDTTTLSNGTRTYIPGIQENESIEFVCNYTETDYATLKAMEGTETFFGVWFGASGDTPDGSDGKFAFKGYLTVYVPGKGVNEVVNMNVNVYPTTDITFSAS